MMQFNKTSKICLALLCLLCYFSAVGLPQDCGATFFMKKIPLTKGLFALVDDEDFDFLNQWKWHAHEGGEGLFYAIRTEWIKGGKGKSIHHRMHRVIMKVSDRSILVDHRNGNGLDNQKLNLRKCTHEQNESNRRGLNSNNTSGYRGVHFNKKMQRWQSAIWKKNKITYIGIFDTKEEAALAYNKKAIELRGEFAKLNILQ